jgi:hypothetical protein
LNSDHATVVDTFHVAATLPPVRDSSVPAVIVPPGGSVQVTTFARFCGLPSDRVQAKVQRALVAAARAAIADR